MNPEKELKRARGMAVILFVVGVVCYAAFSATPPETPLRIMQQSSMGNVLFSHEVHAEDYGISCADCHHHAPDEEDVPQSCGACHDLPEDGTAPASCLACHEADDFEIGDVPNNENAFHNQCVGCHEENGAGPPKNPCSACHVK